MTLRRINRNRRLSPEEAAKYREVREQIREELPDLIALSTLAPGQRLTPTIDTLVRYAEALGKRLVVSLANE